MTDAIINKAHAYLTEGKVKVITATDANAHLEVQGSDSHPYHVGFLAGSWGCDCPARKQCAHVVAAMLISPLRNSDRPTIGNLDPELQGFLDTLRLQPQEDDNGFEDGG